MYIYDYKYTYLNIDQDTIVSFASGIGVLRALVVQRTFTQKDLERIKVLFKQIEQAYNEKEKEAAA